MAVTTYTVELTGRQVDVLEYHFGVNVDITARLQRIINQTLQRLTEELDDQERKTLKQSYETANAAVRTQVRDLLNITKEPPRPTPFPSI